MHWYWAKGPNACVCGRVGLEGGEGGLGFTFWCTVFWLSALGQYDRYIQSVGELNIVYV